MSTAALWSGWQAFRSGPLPGPLAPASPAAVGGPLDQQVYAGSTAHYNFYYPANHVTLGIQPDLITQVMAQVETDYALLESWFGASYPAITNIDVRIYDGTGGGLITWNGGGTEILISINDNDFPYPETLRTLILHETAHAFEWQLDLVNGVYGSDDTGWFFSTTSGSRGEVLCRFLHSVFLAEHLDAASSGWLDRNQYGVTQNWLNSARTDYVNTAATSVNDPTAVTGCGVLFLYYLKDQLGYTIPQIIAAGGLADTLQDIYQTLTGDAADPFPKFKGLLDGAFPSEIRTGIAGENPENPWPIGTPILTDTLPGAVLIVQAAWGADLDIDDSLWSWGDITRDVRQSDGATVTITAGRNDEASTTQPAQATMLLDNRAGRYALGGQNPLYPYLRRNAPIRISVSLDYGITWTTLFFGSADGWSPDWDLTGRDAVVRLSASGVLRRLLQGNPESISAYRRFVEDLTDYQPVAYWPMEAGEDATSFAAAIGDADGRYTMVSSTAFSPPKAAANSDFIASHPLPTVGDCALTAPVPWRRDSGEVSLTVMVGFPDSGITDRQPIMFLDVSGSSDWWWIEYGTGGTLYVVCEDRYGTSKVNDGWAFDIDGARGLLQLDLVQSGGNVAYTVGWLDQGADLGVEGTGTCTSRTLGHAQAIYLNTFLDSFDDGIAPAEILTPSSTELVFGHATVRNIVLPLVAASSVLGGYAGEGTGNRLDRVTAESGLPVELYPTPWLPADPAASVVDLMGPQNPGAALDQLREIETVDGGILFDGFHQGLSYMSRACRMSRPADVTLDVAAGHLLDPFHPDDDDRHATNRVIVQRPAGSEVSAEDVDGPLGSATIGLYEASVEVNTFVDAAAVQQAAWRVHLGTVVGYRYPTLVFDLAKSPTLAPEWVGCPVGGRIAVANLLDARTQHPGGDLALSLEGFTQEIDQKRWTVEANCSLFDPWLVVQTEPTVGDPDGPVSVDTGSSVLARFAPAAATELHVTVTEGPDWTTDPDDYPMVLDVDGMPVTVTGCTAAAELAGSAPVTVGYQLDDDFDDNSVDTVLWPFNYGTTGESAGVAQVTAAAAGTFSGFESDDAYTLADSTLTAKIGLPSLETSAWAVAALTMYDIASGYTTYIRLYAEIDTGPTYLLGLYAQVNGQQAFNVGYTWSPTVYPWLRLREQGGQLYVEVSADGARWLLLGRQDTPVAMRESTALSVDLEAYRDPGASAGTPATFDNVTLTETTRRSQTFTVADTAAVLTAKPAGAVVRLWQAPTLAL